MRAIPQIVEARIAHIPAICSRVREADRLELWSFACVTPAQAMYYGLNQSRFARTGFVGGDAVCMFGVSTISAVTGSGRPWLVGTDLLDKYAIRFLRECAPVVEEMLSHYETLENYVDVRNGKAIAWLLWLGFSFESEPVFMGVHKIPFIKFTKGARA